MPRGLMRYGKRVYWASVKQVGNLPYNIERIRYLVAVASLTQFSDRTVC